MSLQTLLHPVIIDGLSYIPPASAKDFEEEFAGILPPGRSISSSWGTTHYYDFSPNAPASARRVLLIHGIGTPAIGLAPLALALTKSGVHVVTYDLWGHGNSSTPLQAHSPALMHSQIFELLSHLKWSTAHFLGYSMGSSILATFLAIHGHVVESAVFVCGAGLWKMEDRGWKTGLWTETEWEAVGFGADAIMDMIEGTNRVIKEGWKERLAKGEVESEPVQKWERENHAGHAASLVSLFRYGSVWNQHDAYRSVAQGETKTMFILAEKDSFFEVNYMRKELDKLGWKEENIKVMYGAEHGVSRSHPLELAELVREVWNRV